MNLSEERKQNIRHRVKPILTELDPQLKLVDILVESTREFLGFVVQRGEQPMVLRVEWIKYSGFRTTELRNLLAKQIQERLSRNTKQRKSGLPAATESGLRPSLFGKPFGEYVHFVRWGILLQVLMGMVRVGVGALGVPYEKGTHLTSLTILTLFLAVYFGFAGAHSGFGRYRHLLPLVGLLALTMFGLIISGIFLNAYLYVPGYFHAPGHGFVPGEMTAPAHVIGHLTAIIPANVIFYLLSCVSFFVTSRLHSSSAAGAQQT